MRTPAVCTLMFLLSAILTSCKKETANNPEPPSSLIGSSWAVVNDSTSVAAGAIAPASGSNYIGKAGDYFNFTSYGKLYWSINGQKDTVTYLISGDTLKFKVAYIDGQTNKVDSAYNPIYTIRNVTSHTCTLFNSTALLTTNGGGGPELTTINLKK